jgi:hypothetical protein
MMGTQESAGGAGACRIIWGPRRAYPSRNVKDVNVNTPLPPVTLNTAGNVYSREKFNYQLASAFVYPRDLKPGVRVYFIDGFLNSPETLATLKANNFIAVCYMR